MKEIEGIAERKARTSPFKRFPHKEYDAQQEIDEYNKAALANASGNEGYDDDIINPMHKATYDAFNTMYQTAQANQKKSLALKAILIGRKAEWSSYFDI